MWMGHYAPALLVKAVDPTIPLWMPVLAAQFIDVLWATFNLIGIEQIEFPQPPPSGFPADLVNMRWSHSLPMAVLWSVLFSVIVSRVFNVSNKQKVLLVLSVFSHWICDFLVHHPDLAITLSPTSRRVGCGLWTVPVAEATFEMYLLGASALFWASSHLKRRTTAGVGPILSFFTILAALQFGTQASAPATEAKHLLLPALATYAGCTVLATILDT